MAISAIDQQVADTYAIYNGDSCEILKEMPADSIDYMVFSPPFASLYTYSNSERDLGNCKSREDFFQHYRFVATELYRVLKPGRVMSFHCMNLPSTKERDGFIGIHDFRGDLIRAHQSDGFIFHSEVCIWKDPVTAMQRTKAIGLLYKQLRKDSCISRQGIPDYLVTMRKPGENALRVTKTFDGFPVGRWQQYASPVWNDIDNNETWAARRAAPDVREWAIQDIYPTSAWMDINPSDTLQRESAREDNDERHICPLQLQVIERGIELWTNPHDVVLDPFAGIGSTGYVAIRNGRRFVGCELKGSYYKQAALNLQRAVEEATQAVLFAEEGEEIAEFPGEEGL